MTRVLAPVFADKILRCLDRIVGLLDGLSDEQANWSPPVSESNSVAGIANHILANVEENVLTVIAGHSGERDRSAEFAPASASAVRERWNALRPRIADALDAVDDAALQAECTHPRRGTITIGEMLMVLRAHTAEHEGEARLTRDMALAALR